MKWAFLHADTNLGKLKFTFIIIWWAWSKNAEDPLQLYLLKTVIRFQCLQEKF